MVPVQRGELLAVVPGEGVTGVPVVTSHPELVEVGLGLQPEAGVLGEHLLPGPVLQRDQQLIVGLVGQPVDVLQTQPVLSIDVTKALLWRGGPSGNNRAVRKHGRHPFQLLVCETCLCEGSGPSIGNDLFHSTWMIIGLGFSSAVVYYQGTLKQTERESSL